MDASKYSDLLKQAMSEPFDPGLPPRTQDEQRAGRERLIGHLRASVVDTGLEELRERFSKRALPSAGLHFDEKKERWVADVVIHTAAKTNMVLEDDLLSFPSEHLIAQIALVT